MNKIPVSFDYSGLKYKGYFSEIIGAGLEGGRWDLIVDNYYWGSLQKVGPENWRFNEQNPRIAHLVDDFAAVLIAWYQ